MSLKDDLQRMTAEDERLPAGEPVLVPMDPSTGEFSIRVMTEGGYVHTDWDGWARFVVSARTDRPALVKMVRLLIERDRFNRDAVVEPNRSWFDEDIEKLWAEAKAKRK
jgi:hypothetical protein